MATTTLSADPKPRRKRHVDHLGIHPQRHSSQDGGKTLFYAGLLMPVGRITIAPRRGVADLGERGGSMPYPWEAREGKKYQVTEAAENTERKSTSVPLP